MQKKLILTSILLLFVFGFFFVSCSKKEKTEAHVAHILLQYKGSLRAPFTVTRTKEEAKAEIEELLAKIKDGADFAELARQYSDCPSKQNGGNLGKFARGVMAKPFEDAAFKLKKDQISEIVETDFGYHIIKGLE
ncbi:peptidyl-prolyl cis-trans isomerase [candidate division KSB1 bacterium]|nr:peptidyl-prolyl cis-trans isomerase [candidate division KSB1 bacterium]